jgi:all-trans-8'-apo-beta-carotenal 15,15'-oxygenase
MNALQQGLATVGRGPPHDLPSPPPPQSCADSFARALAADPALAGYQGVSCDGLLTSRVAVEGALPAGLRGTLYRNGPALHELGGLRYRTWLDGDGMVQAFRFTDRGIEHTGRLVLTEKLAAEIAAGRRRRSVFGTVIDGADAPSGPDSLNVANTSVLPFGEDLLALWEGGSAHRLDRESLQTIGPKVWRADLKGLPFSAHPRVDTTGRLWNFGLDTLNSVLVLYEVSAAGTLARAELVRVPDMTMVHDFVVTARHLVFLLPPLRFDRQRLEQGASFLDCHEWREGAPLRVLVVDKADLRTYRLFELPNGFVFHLGNGWEDDTGVLRFDYVRAPDAATLMVRQKELMRGAVSEGSPGETSLVTLDPATGRISETTIQGAVEFPRIDPRVVGERYRHLYLAVNSSGCSRRTGYDAVRRLDVESGKVDQFHYGEGIMVEEHVFVPDRTSAREGAGWLLGTALDITRSLTVVSVLDAMDVGAGPIARAWLPYALPLGLHGNFLAA